MKRVKWLLLMMLVACGGLLAQTVQVTVGLTAPSATFYVDGMPFGSAQSFLWPVGSKHILQFPFSVDMNGGLLPFQASDYDTVRWTFGGWKDNLGLIQPSSAAVQTIVAASGLSSIVGTATPSFQLTVTYASGAGDAGTNTQCTGAPGTPTPGALGWGLLYVNGTCYSDSVVTYVPAGQVILNAYPFPGYGFLGFGAAGDPGTPYLYRFNLTEATALTALFSPAKRVSFRTNPLGLAVTIDQETIITPPAPPTSLLPSTNYNSSCTPNYATLPPGTPSGITPLCIGDFDFLPGSAHRVGAPTSQQDNNGAWWVFNGFSDGLGQNGTYIADSQTNVADDVIANFTPGVQAVMLTNPAGLQVSVDGTTAWQSYSFVWAQGSTHTISAPATQVDAAGRTWQFVSWSNGGSATQTITMPSSGTGMVVTAIYAELGQVQVTSVPPGLTFTVGGNTCTTPCAVSQASGSQVQITAPSSVPLSATSRLDFASWSGGGPGTASFQATFTQGVQAFTANYQISYLLNATANPANAGAFKTSPPSPDGFFAAGTQVSITPVANSGFKFTGWTGDISGVLTPGYLTMSTPHGVVANFAAVPTIPPAGIISAAGPTPDGSVAPGSIISIYGQNLADTLINGPTNPLKQTLGNVTVTVNNMLMPLLFVSPGQINAQVPVELTDGTYTLTVNYQGQPPVSGTFTVKKNAPGVFTQGDAQNQQLAAALHQDGSLITPSSPAKRGEIVSLYGTGFGLTQAIIDGFPAPMTPLIPASGPVSINASGVTVPATWAGAAPTLVGTDIVQLQIVDSIPSATTLNVTVTAGDSQSSMVQLPVE